MYVRNYTFSQRQRFKNIKKYYSITNSAPKNLMYQIFIRFVLNLQQPTASTEKKINLKPQEHSFQTHDTKLWNEIPASLRNKIKSTFKRNLNSHLFTTLLEQDNYILKTENNNFRCHNISYLLRYVNKSREHEGTERDTPSRVHA